MPESTKINRLHILLVEDSETDAEIIKRVLGRQLGSSCRIQHVESMAGAEAALKENTDIDLILLDLGLPDTVGGEDSFRRIEDVREQIPVIILTSTHDHQLAVGIIGKGAEDYVRKSSISRDPRTLCDAIDFAISRRKNIETLIEQTDKELEEKDKIISWMSGGEPLHPAGK